MKIWYFEQTGIWWCATNNFLLNHDAVYEMKWDLIVWQEQICVGPEVYYLVSSSMSRRNVTCVVSNDIVYDCIVHVNWF